MGYESIKIKKKSHFLVAGGAGFIGSNICEALNEGLKKLSFGTRRIFSEFV